MKKIFTIVLSFITFSLYAQDVAFKKGNFKDDKSGFEKAKANLVSGDEWLEKGKAKVLVMEYAADEYSKALEYYLPAQKFNPNNSQLNRKIGHAYLYTNTPYKAMPFLKKSLELAGDKSSPFLYFLLGKAYQLEQDFEQAEKSFLRYGTLANDKELEPYKKLNRKHIKECKSGSEILGMKTRVWVDNVKELNSFYDDISPSISADGSEIIFNTNKSGNFDIYSAERKNRKWQSLKALNSLNSEGDDVSSSLAYDGQRMLLFKQIDGQSDIYESKLMGTEWSEPKLKMSKVVNSNANETFASLRSTRY